MGSKEWSDAYDRYNSLDAGDRRKVADIYDDMFISYRRDNNDLVVPRGPTDGNLLQAAINKHLGVIPDDPAKDYEEAIMAVEIMANLK